MNARGLLLIAVLSLGMSAPASAAVFSSGPVGLDLAPFDDGYDGTLASMAASTIDIVDVGIIEAVSVTVALDHTWVGDLVLRLVSGSGTTIDLMNRPGFDGPDDGSGCCGAGLATNADEHLVFDDFAPTPAENYAAGLSFYAPQDSLALLIGESIAGTWTLYIGDSAGGDFGLLDSWSLNITTAPVPLPAGVWLLLSATGGLLLRRRRAN